MGRAWKMSQKKDHLKGAQKRGVELDLWKWMGVFRQEGIKNKEAGTCGMYSRNTWAKPRRV